MGTTVKLPWTRDIAKVLTLHIEQSEMLYDVVHVADAASSSDVIERLAVQVMTVELQGNYMRHALWYALAGGVHFGAWDLAIGHALRMFLSVRCKMNKATMAVIYDYLALDEAHREKRWLRSIAGLFNLPQVVVKAAQEACPKVASYVAKHKPLFGDDKKRVLMTAMFYSKNQLPNGDDDDTTTTKPDINKIWWNGECWKPRTSEDMFCAVPHVHYLVIQRLSLCYFDDRMMDFYVLRMDYNGYFNPKLLIRRSPQRICSSLEEANELIDNDCSDNDWDFDEFGRTLVPYFPYALRNTFEKMATNVDTYDISTQHRYSPDWGTMSHIMANMVDFSPNLPIKQGLETLRLKGYLKDYNRKMKKWFSTPKQRHDDRLVLTPSCLKRNIEKQAKQHRQKRERDALQLRLAKARKRKQQQQQQHEGQMWNCGGSGWKHKRRTGTGVCVLD